MAKSSLGGEVYAFGEMLNHMSMRRDLYVHFIDLTLGMGGMEDCESLFTHLKNKKIATERFLV